MLGKIISRARGTNEPKQRPKPSELRGWQQPAGLVIRSVMQRSFHHPLVSEGSPWPGEHPRVLMARGRWCQTQRMHQVGLLGLPLNDGFVTFITPRM